MEHERIISVLDYLSRYTDETRGVTAKEIQIYLSNTTNMKPVSCLTIRRDMERLIAMGNDIRVEKGAHNTSYYRLIGKGFTFNEIRFIVDSISINKFISDVEKKKLIKKFEGMCSESEVRQLISRVSLNGRSIPSADLLENLEKVHRIISNQEKIDFEYGKFNVQKKRDFYDKKRNLVPFTVIYFDDRFYLKCVDMETNEFRTYRIDRMRRITAGDKTKFQVKLPKYEGVVVDMFEPDYFETVRLRVKRFLLDEMVERFGEQAFTRDDTENPDCVIVRVCVGINDSFYRWIMRYGSNIEVLSPPKVRNGFQRALKQVYCIYEK